MSPIKRIAILYSVPRSGSTYVEKAIGSYLQTHYGHTSLSELFNVNLVASSQNNQIIIDTDNWRENTYQYTLTIAEVKKIQAERMGWLNQNEENYFIKLLEAQLTNEHMEKIFPTSTIIFCRRENLWEHLLSFLISMTTYQFYPKDGMKWEPGSIKASFELFAAFGSYMGRYRRMKKAYPECVEIVFEQFLEKGSAYMRSMGFQKEFDWDGVWYPAKENLRDKNLAFSNIDEIKSWYRQSYFNLLHPISET